MTDVRAPQSSTAETDATAPFGIAETELDENQGGATAGPPAAGADWPRWLWRQLTSMRTALVLLFLLALGSVPGSVLPQQGSDPAAVQQYFTGHPALAPWLNHLGLFNVFAAPWFAAIYLLLFTSLVGCVVPRTFRLAGSARTPPPRAPRNLERLPHSGSYQSALSPQAAARVAAAALGGHRFRLRRPAATDEGHWVAAEKGYLREAGNLLFHLALLGVLVSIALGGLFGYKADKLLVEGGAFTNTRAALDEFHPGRLVSAGDLAPFGITLNSFSASYLDSGQSRGQPAAFHAHLTYTASPGGAAHSFDLQVNHPLNVDSTKVYLIGHGYAPVFKVTTAGGQVVYDQATPFIPANTGTFVSDGVIKVPDAAPSQLGFMGVFVPTAIRVGDTLESAFPAPDNPVVSLIGYSGNLGENSGIPQSVYQLDTTAMRPLTATPQVLVPGQTWTLPGGNGKLTFVGYKQWVSLAITYDPGQLPALVCGILALAGLLLSFLVRRRRVFVRAVPAPGGTGSVVTVGGLARTDASGGFEDEFASLSAELAAADATVGAGAAADAADSGPVTPAPPAAPAAATRARGAGGGGGTGLPARQVPPLRAIWQAGPWVRIAVTLSAVGILAHLVAVITRGYAVHRAPWGNMYEFVTALTCVAAVFFGYVVIRYRAWALGVFVMGAVVLALGLAETVIYTAAGPLVPALQSYWLSIHVTAMTLATGIFFVAAVLGLMYLVAERYRARVAAGKAEPGNGLLARIPSAAQLDKLTYRTVIFGFPVWTFGVIAGAIWADQAWGRYWGWDPVETWAFITWVVYAAYLHARATAGWRGRAAHFIQLLGFTSLVFNMVVVQVFIAGMHSYAGVS